MGIVLLTDDESKTFCLIQFFIASISFNTMTKRPSAFCLRSVLMMSVRCLSDDSQMSDAVMRSACSS